MEQPKLLRQRSSGLNQPGLSRSSSSRLAAAEEGGSPSKQRRGGCRWFVFGFGFALLMLSLLALASRGGRGGGPHDQTETRELQSASSPYGILASGSCANAPTVTASFTSVTYLAIVADVKALLAAQDQTCSGSTCPVARLAGCIVRMAGHDFMDYVPTAASGQTGGSDGCVDFNDGDNAGLSACLAYGTNLGAIYSKYCMSLSLADFIVIAAEAVMIVRSQCSPVYFDSSVAPAGCSGTSCFKNYSTLRSYTVPFCSGGTLDASYMAQSFKYGRVTSTSCSWAHGRLPSPGDGCPTNQAHFMTNMGLGWDEITSLMGVHTLGGASIANSGYNGFWSDVVNQTFFNNNYYQSLVGKGWMPQLAVNGNSLKNQWIRSDSQASSTTEFMLDTDICLMFNYLNATTNTYTEIHASSSNCCAWVTGGSLGGCGSTNFRSSDPMQCWDETIDPSRSFLCAARGTCCRSARGLGNCGSTSDPMETPAWNLVTASGTNGASTNFMSYDWVKLYAANSTRWYSDFLSVWSKVTTIGQSGLKCPDDLGCRTTTTSTTTVTTTTKTTATTTTATETTTTKTSTTSVTTTSTTKSTTSVITTTTTKRRR